MCKCGTGRSRAFWQEDGADRHCGFCSWKPYLPKSWWEVVSNTCPPGWDSRLQVCRGTGLCLQGSCSARPIDLQISKVSSPFNCQNASSRPEMANKGMRCRVHPKMSHQNVAGVSPNCFSLNVMTMFTPLFQSTFLCYSTHCTQRTWSAPPHVC